MKRKSNNPFKMWGSWIAPIITITVFQLLAFRITTDRASTGSNVFTLFLSNFQDTSQPFYNSAWLGMILFLVVFPFLIGWGINVLWRKLK